jgi:polyisoprenoid-binding protein YceI
MKRLVLIALVLCVLAPYQAMANEWQLDPAHSGFMFEIKHIYSTIRGQFNSFSGSVFFDPEHPEKSRCEFVVKVDSIHTNNGKRDNHLRSKDFFDADNYPAMTFKSTQVSPAGANKYLLQGQLTIKDVTQDVSVELVYKGQKENPFKKKQLVAGFDTRLTIDRLAYNVGSGQLYTMGIVAKKVDILVSLELVREK